MNKKIIAYLLLSFCFGAGIFYWVGYGARHVPKYISIDKHGATKAMKNAGITEQQIDAVYEYIKRGK